MSVHPAAVVVGVSQAERARRLQNWLFFDNPSALQGLARQAVVQEYLDLLKAAFKTVTVDQQTPLLLQLLPSEATLRLVAQDRPLSARITSEVIRSAVGTYYTDMVARFMLLEEKDGGRVDCPENVRSLILHGQGLLDYVFWLFGHDLSTLHTLFQLTVRAVKTKLRNEPHLAPLVFGVFAATDIFVAWLVRTITASPGFQADTPDRQRIRLWQIYVFLRDQASRRSLFPERWPSTAALLQDAFLAQEEVLRAAERQHAADALANRLRARRRLSIPFYIEPSAPPAEGLQVLPSRGGRAERRASRPTALTSESSSADIRQFLASQIAQEEALVTVLGGARPNPQRASRKRTGSSSSSALSQPPLVRNCERFAARCEEKTNLEGKDWCAVPESFWWGPLQPGNHCYDIRDILKHNAHQVIAVPGVREAHPPTYPDRRPLSDNYLRTFVEIARQNNHQVPPEIELYLTGRQLQQHPLPKLFPLGSAERQRLLQVPAYLAPLAFEEQRAVDVLRETQAAMSIPSV